MTTLIIIDVQTAFINGETLAERNAIAEVERQVRLARRRKAPIILVEMKWANNTLRSIRQLLDDYPYVHLVRKSSPDGSNNILRCAAQHKIPLDRVRVVGTYSDGCVRATIVGLTQRPNVKKITIVKKGCWPEFGFYVLRSSFPQVTLA